MSVAKPSLWIRIVSPIIALVGLWIAGFSAVTVHRAWYFAIYADEYVAADFVIHDIEHFTAGTSSGSRHYWVANGKVGDTEEVYDLKQVQFRLPFERRELEAMFPKGMVITVWYNSTASRKSNFRSSRRVMSAERYGEYPWWKVLWVTTAAYSPLLIGSSMLIYITRKYRANSGDQ